MRARGVLLVDDASEGSPELQLEVSVTAGEAGGRHAVLELRSHRGGQLRELQAEHCEELRKAVAWVLVVLAEERALAASVATEVQPKPAIPSSSTRGLAPAPRVEPRASHATEGERKATPPFVPSNGGRASFRLGTAFVTGFGFGPRPALGPSFFVEVQPGPGSPALRLSLLQLATLPYERDQTSIDVERLALRGSVASNAIWKPLAIGLDAEAGRLTGSGSGSDVSPGKDREPWLAFGLSAKLVVPVLPRILVAELGASFDYTPLSYSFRYRSGQELSTSGPVEGRAQAGLAARW